MLSVLRTASPKLRKVMLKNVPPEIIKTLAECAYNILHGNVPICDKSHRRLKKYKNTLRRFSQPHSSITSKRRIILQKGGWLTPLLGIVGTLLSQYL